MIQTLLSYGNGAKTSQLTSQLWEKDIVYKINLNLLVLSSNC